MSTPDGARAFTDLEHNTDQVVEAMRLAGRLLRALAPLAAEMRDLQGALLQLQDATGQAALPAPALPAADAAASA